MERNRYPAPRLLGDHRSTPILSADPPQATESVSLLVPLLNDAHRVTRCVRALMRQTRIPKLDIVLLDAGSSDLTRQLVLQTIEDDPRVRLLIGSQAPNGWCAYAHACEQLAIAARGKSFVFADPGLALAPGAVAAAVDALRQGSYDLVVAKARQRTRTEPGADTDARLLAVDAEAYWKVNGHCAAAHDPLGETGLIRALRRSGARVTAADGRHAIEFLDGSSWPRDRTFVGTGEPGGGQTTTARHGTSDTESSILHSLTDTARRLLSALALLPPTSPVHSTRTPTTSRGQGSSRTGSARPAMARTIKANQDYVAEQVAMAASVSTDAAVPDPYTTQPQDVLDSE